MRALCLLTTLLLSSATASAQASPGKDELNLKFTGDKRFLFVPVRYPDAPNLGPTVAEVQALVESVQAAFAVNSYGKTDVTEIKVVTEAGGGAVTMPLPTTSYEGMPAGEDVVRVRQDALDAALLADPTADPALFDREVIFSHKVWEGRTAVGGLNYRTALMGNPTAQLYVVLHELGHTLGFEHAQFNQILAAGVPAAALPDGGVTVKEFNYGDRFDLMGDRIVPSCNVREFHHFNPWYKRRARWLTANDVLPVTSGPILYPSGAHSAVTVSFQPLHLSPPSVDPAALPAALQIARDAHTDYWVYWRTTETDPPVGNGILVSRSVRTTTMPVSLLDNTPLSMPDDCLEPCTPPGSCRTYPNDSRDVQLVPGESFEDPAANFRLTVDQLNDQVATVTVAPIDDSLPFGQHDAAPLVDVIEPARGVTFQDGDTFVVAVRKALGFASSVDIGEVDLRIYPLNDGCIDGVKGYPPFLSGDVLQDPCYQAGLLVANAENVAPTANKYHWTPDLSSLASGRYLLIVSARETATGAGLQSVYWFRFLFDAQGV